MSDPINNIDIEGLRNPLKTIISLVNMTNGVRNLAQGAVQVAGGAVASYTGVGTLPGIGAMAAGSVKAGLGYFTMVKGIQQFRDAGHECWDDWALRNLYGLLPFGQHFDDKGETFDDWARNMLNKPVGDAIVHMLTLGVYGN